VETDGLQPRGQVHSERDQREPDLVAGEGFERWVAGEAPRQPVPAMLADLFSARFLGDDTLRCQLEDEPALAKFVELYQCRRTLLWTALSPATEGIDYR